jgi:iron complex transport system substrate-binding protein
VLDTIHLQTMLLDATAWDILGVPTPGRWLHLTPSAHARIAECWSELRDEWQRGTPEASWLLAPLFGRLLVRLTRLGRSVQESGPHEETVAVAVRYLDEHFAEPVRIEQLAGRVFLSPDRFTEVFVAAMGQTPRDYLKHLRLECAKNLLATTRTPIAQVGLLSGFSDPAYFARVFKESVGTSPRLWRDSCISPGSG